MKNNCDACEFEKEKDTKVDSECHTCHDESAARGFADNCTCAYGKVSVLPLSEHASHCPLFAMPVSRQEFDALRKEVRRLSVLTDHCYDVCEKCNNDNWQDAVRDNEFFAHMKKIIETAAGTQAEVSAPKAIDDVDLHYAIQILQNTNKVYDCYPNNTLAGKRIEKSVQAAIGILRQHQSTKNNGK